MKLFKRTNDIKEIISKFKRNNLSIGFVPTMGALHDGHLKLILESKNICDVTVSSIFVNPTQFNDKNDFNKYPRTTEKDLERLLNTGCDILFLPSEKDIYPSENDKNYPLGALEQVFEGAFRPGHFQGVCQVVDRLFKIITPDEVFFGQKDYQQCMVINKLLKTDPSFKQINMNIVPTVREPDGLAMSSRNMRLSNEERKIAPVIYESLQLVKQNLQPGDLTNLTDEAKHKLTEAGLAPDYFSIAHAETLEQINNWNGKDPLVALVAAFLGEIRLIDNLTLTN